MSDHKRKLALAAVIVASATAISRLTGLGREVITAAVYGVDPSYNTFVSVSVIPQLVQQLFADAAISAAFVPVFTSLLAKGDRERAYRLAANLLGLIVVVVGAAVVVLALAAEPLTRLMYPELTGTPAGAELAADLLRILVPTILFLSIAGAISGVLYSFERFTMPAVVPIVWNLIIIAAIAVFQESLGVDAIAWGMLVGTLLEVVMLACAARYHGRWLWPRFGLRDPLLRRVLLLMVPITITLGVLNFNALIGTWFAQFVSDRAAAEIGYAFRLYQLPQGIFAVTIGTVLFPSLSRFAAQKDEVRFRDTVSLGVRQMVFVSLPFVAWFAVMPQAFVRLVYERGQFGSGATVEVAGALAFFSVGPRVRELQHHAQPGLPEHAEAVAADVRGLRQPGRELRPVLAAVQAARGGGDHAEHGDRVGGQLLRPLPAAPPRGRPDRRPPDGRGGGWRPALRRGARGRLLRRLVGARGLRRRRVPAAGGRRVRGRRDRRRRLSRARQAAQARGAQRGAAGAAQAPGGRATATRRGLTARRRLGLTAQGLVTS